jgi:hypothetical protein
VAVTLDVVIGQALLVAALLVAVTLDVVIGQALLVAALLVAVALDVVIVELRHLPLLHECW